MALLNVDASLPPFMWAVLRLLLAERKPVAVERARGLLSPPSLASNAKQDKTVDSAVRTLRELGLVAVEEQRLSLSGEAIGLDGRDPAAFARVLRRAVLDSERNLGLAEQASQAGPRDLTRTLVWFLSRDPLEAPATWDIAQEEQSVALNPDAGAPSKNDTRWNRFVHWAPALGFGAAPLLPTGGQGPLVPDCTSAVKQTVGYLWATGGRIDAVEAVQAIRAALPVLPGGVYASALGVPDPGPGDAGAALSFALLRGEDEGWLELHRDADAQRVLAIADPDRPSHYASDITINPEGRRG